MTTTRDPYPPELIDEQNVFVEAGAVIPESIDAGTREQIRALNRIATALEQLVLNHMDRSQPVQNAPGAALAALPPVQTQQPATNGVCPIHNAPWKTVPAGVSKKTGAAYTAFQACSVSGCDQRPPR